MLRVFVFISTIILLSVTALAQNNGDDEIETFFGGKDFKSSGYGGPHIKFTQFNDDFSIMVGGRGGWTINKIFTIGLSGSGLVTLPQIDYYDEVERENINADLVFGYGGLYLEYINKPQSMVHFSGNCLFGFGGSALADRRDYLHNGHDYDYDGNHEPWAAYFVLEPALAVEFNVTSFFRIGVEASYRIVEEIRSSDSFKNVDELKDFQPSGFSGGLVFQFGSF